MRIKRLRFRAAAAIENAVAISAGHRRCVRLASAREQTESQDCGAKGTKNRIHVKKESRGAVCARPADASQVVQSLFAGTAIAAQNRYHQGGILRRRRAFPLAARPELVVIITP